MTMRKFYLFTEPSLSDPSWIVPLAEATGPGEFVNYSDLSVLKTVVAEMEEQRIRNDERNKATSACLAVFGLTYDDYFARLKANKDGVETSGGMEEIVERGTPTVPLQPE